MGISSIPTPPPSVGLVGAPREVPLPNPIPIARGLVIIAFKAVGGIAALVKRGFVKQFRKEAETGLGGLPYWLPHQWAEDPGISYEPPFTGGQKAGVTYAIRLRRRFDNADVSGVHWQCAWPHSNNYRGPILGYVSEAYQSYNDGTGRWYYRGGVNCGSQSGNIYPHWSRYWTDYKPISPINDYYVSEVWACYGAVDDAGNPPPPPGFEEKPPQFSRPANPAPPPTPETDPAPLMRTKPDRRKPKIQTKAEQKQRETPFEFLAPPPKKPKEINKYIPPGLNLNKHIAPPPAQRKKEEPTIVFDGKEISLELPREQYKLGDTEIDIEPPPEQIIIGGKSYDVDRVKGKKPTEEIVILNGKEYRIGEGEGVLQIGDQVYEIGKEPEESTIRIGDKEWVLGGGGSYARIRDPRPKKPSAPVNNSDKKAVDIPDLINKQKVIIDGKEYIAEKKYYRAGKSPIQIASGGKKTVTINGRTYKLYQFPKVRLQIMPQE